jgi:LysM repeat protein/rare lipoprotein A (peptidoglycan hydrolase)
MMKMMKYVFCCLVLLGQADISFGQARQDTLLVVPARNGLYFYHVVSKKETLYSLSRKFGVDVKALASFNKLSPKSQLKMYQLLKIPLNSHNLNQSAGASAATTLAPLYHKVMKGETLYHISSLYGKVPDALLKKWNHLNRNEVRIGQYLIVGWLNAGGGTAPNKLASAPPPGAAAAVKTGQQAVAAAQKKVLPEKAAVTSPVKIEQGTVAAAGGDTQKKTPPQQAGSGGGSTVHSSGDNAFLDEVIAAENENRGKKSSAPARGKTTLPPAHRPAAQTADQAVKTTAVAVQGEDDAFSVGTPAPAGKPSGRKPKAVEKAEGKMIPADDTPAATPPGGNAKAVKDVPNEVVLAAPSKKDSPQKAAAPAKTDSFALMLNRVTTGPKKAATKAVHKVSTPKANTPKVTTPETSTAGSNTTAGITSSHKAGQTRALPGQAVPGNAPAGKPVVVTGQPGPSAAMNPVTDSIRLTPTVKSKFQQLYETQTDNGSKITMQKGAAGWFRSNVKPGSGSYYALCDDLPRGTVVKVTNPINQRSVLVKVLDVIPKQKDNYNLIIKLSDAAMGDLGTSQSRFWCEIRYPEGKDKN